MSFIDDKEKMRDFYELTKDEFLKSYSYLREEDYQETMKDNVLEFLHQSEDYQDYNLEYILANENDYKNALAVASMGDEIIEIKVFSNEISNVPEWSYNIDDDIFSELEKGKFIEYMSMDCHYGIWCMVEDYSLDSIEYKKGMQKYLQYCKDNGITKEKLEEINKTKLLNIMEYYQSEKQKKSRER